MKPPATRPTPQVPSDILTLDLLRIETVKGARLVIPANTRVRNVQPTVDSGWTLEVELGPEREWTQCVTWTEPVGVPEARLHRTRITKIAARVRAALKDLHPGDRLAVLGKLRVCVRCGGDIRQERCLCDGATATAGEPDPEEAFADAVLTKDGTLVRIPRL
jgi:hypothetical protein